MSRHWVCSYRDARDPWPCRPSRRRRHAGGGMGADRSGDEEAGSRNGDHRSCCRARAERRGTRRGPAIEARRGRPAGRDRLGSSRAARRGSFPRPRAAPPQRGPPHSFAHIGGPVPVLHPGGRSAASGAPIAGVDGSADQPSSEPATDDAAAPPAAAAEPVPQPVALPEPQAVAEPVALAVAEPLSDSAHPHDHAHADPAGGRSVGQIRRASGAIQGGSHPLSAGSRTVPGGTSSSMASRVSASRRTSAPASSSRSCWGVRGPMMAEVTAG